MKLPHYPSPALKEYGEKLLSAMFDASIQYSMAGVGGCKEYDSSNFPTEMIPFIEEYFKGCDDSVAILYAAMRAKELQLEVV